MHMRMRWYVYMLMTHLSLQFVHPRNLRTFKEYYLIGVGFARSNYSRDHSRSALLQALILDGLIRKNWFIFNKEFN